jgi:hypothetical protein
MVMVPLYVFAVRPVVFTDTLTGPAVPEVGLAESHEPPAGIVAATAVKVTPDGLPTVMDCEAGAVLPI